MTLALGSHEPMQQRRDAVTRRFTAQFATGDAEFFSESKTRFTHAWRVFNGKAGRYWQGLAVSASHGELRAEKTAHDFTKREDCKVEVVPATEAAI
jgi:hypothetical protein